MKLNVGDAHLHRTGCLFIVSGPSGAGKTSICTPALARLERLELSVSTTTRAPRGKEVDGVDYRFTSRENFDAMVERGEFAEWAEVHGNRYGTPRSGLDAALRSGRDVLLDIDVQGAAQIREAYPRAVSIFLLPPTREHIQRRLTGRGTDAPETVRRRLDAACAEIGQLPEYDFFIVNDELDEAIEAFLSIVRAERFRTSRFNPARLKTALKLFEDN